MPTVTLVLEGGGQLTVTTLDKSPLTELEKAFTAQRKGPGKEFRVDYQDAVIIVPNAVKVLGGAVFG